MRRRTDRWMPSCGRTGSTCGEPLVKHRLVNHASQRRTEPRWQPPRSVPLLDNHLLSRAAARTSVAGGTTRQLPCASHGGPLRTADRRFWVTSKKVQQWLPHHSSEEQRPPSKPRWTETKHTMQSLPWMCVGGSPGSQTSRGTTATSTERIARTVLKVVVSI